MQIADARIRCALMKDLNIFITMTDEDGSGDVVAVKDLIDVKGTPTSGGSTVLSMEAKAEDAAVIATLRERGCVVLGKTNMHEWAFGSTSINPHYGTVRNPRDPSRIAGGSSGGSAAAVAAGLCDWAIGTDTGGSVRIPAALCGVVGFKPTLGTIDTSGVLPLSFSLDTIGSLAPDVWTAIHAVELMARTERWATTEAIAPSDLRLAIPAGWVGDLDPLVEAAWVEVSRDLPEILLPPLAQLNRGCLDIMYAEAGAYHRRWIAECPERYGADVLERLRGTFTVSGADYVDAMLGRDRARESVAEAMEGYDAVLLPATAAVAPLIKQRVNSEPLTRFTRPFNYTGQPVFSLPARGPGLPVGIQVVGRVGGDAELASVAVALEQGWSRSQAGA